MNKALDMTKAKKITLDFRSMKEFTVATGPLAVKVVTKHSDQATSWPDIDARTPERGLTSVTTAP